MTTITKHQVLNLRKLNTVSISIKNPKATNKHVTIEDILTHCEVSPKAIIVIEHLEFFLKTNEDRNTFINEYESRQLWRDRKKGLKVLALSKEIGSYNHTYSSLEQLEKMSLLDALEHLFLQPVNCVMEELFIESKATLKKVYDLKQANPKLLLMNALLHV